MFIQMQTIARKLRKTQINGITFWLQVTRHVNSVWVTSTRNKNEILNAYKISVLSFAFTMQFNCCYCQFDCFNLNIISVLYWMINKYMMQSRLTSILEMYVFLQKFMHVRVLKIINYKFHLRVIDIELYKSLFCSQVVFELVSKIVQR